MKRLIASFCSALILMAWSALYWLVLPIPTSSTMAIQNEADTVSFLQGQLPESGVYFYPSLPEKSFEPGFFEKQKQGPFLQIFYHKDGQSLLSLRHLGLGFFHFWLSSLLLIGLLSVTGAQFFSFRRKMLVIGVASLFAAIAIHGFYPIWLHQDFFYHATQMAFTSIGFTLAGLVLTSFPKPNHPFSSSITLSSY